MEQKRVSRKDLLAVARAQVLTTADLAKVLGTTRPHAARLAFGLRKRGMLTLVKRGVYASVPLDVDPEGFRADPFLAVHKALGPRFAFSHQSALTLLGAEQTVRRTLHVSAPGVRSRRRTVGKFLVHIHGVAHEGWGHATTRVRRGGESLLATSPERTLVDLASQPNRHQDYEEDLEAFRTLLPRVDPGKLLDSALRTESPTTRARVGHLLKIATGSSPEWAVVLRSLHSSLAHASPSYFATEPRAESNRYDSEFKLVCPGAR